MKRKLRHLYQTSTLLSVGCFAVLGGILLAKTGQPFSTVMFLVVCLAIFLRGRTVVAVLAVVCIGLMIGWWRGSQVWKGMVVYQDYFGKQVVLNVRAAEDAVYNDKQQFAFAADNIQILDDAGTYRPVPGRASLSGFWVRAVYRGDAVRVSGKLFPSRGSTVVRVSFANLQVTGRPNDTLWKFRQKFTAGLQTALPEPLSSFGLGILIGQRSTLPKWMMNDLSNAGLTHLVAVSGYNLTILVNVARRLLKKQSHFQSTIAAAMLVIVFLLITGFSASIVRAAIIAGISIGTGYYGRTVKPVLLLGLSALITALYNPLYIWFDVGWYLSFTAFFGVVVLAPLFTRRFWKEKEPKLVAQVVIESGCAQLVTMPIITGVFGQLSVISMVSNVLILPLVPLAMLFSMMAGLAGSLGPWLGGIIALPGRVLLTYILDLTSVCARLPHSVVPLQLGKWEVGGMYGCVLLLCLMLNRPLRVNRAPP